MARFAAWRQIGVEGRGTVAFRLFREERRHRRACDLRLSGGWGERRLHRRFGRVRQRQEGGGADPRAVPGVRAAAQHIGATPDFARDFAPRRRQRIGARDRADGHAKFVGEVAEWRQFGAGCEAPHLHGIAQRIGDGAVAGTGAGSDVRAIERRNCHGYNKLIESVS